MAEFSSDSSETRRQGNTQILTLREMTLFHFAGFQPHVRHSCNDDAHPQCTASQFLKMLRQNQKRYLSSIFCELPLFHQIGRASCRERVYISVGERLVKSRKQWRGQ